jgi:hypothetical protein
VSSGIPFLIIRRYATFILSKYPASGFKGLGPTRENAMSIKGITNIKQYKNKFSRLKANSKLSFLKKSCIR